MFSEVLVSCSTLAYETVLWAFRHGRNSNFELWNLRESKKTKERENSELKQEGL